ncbi:protein FAR1-RELATED SEQUENCE 12-like [Silene latifolia]|uniref:protein FAR1-RELATED SEQUENCE 12-like n=1 Tax=Silene latifolia TaxID=37657 RepID=UPI003D772810
MESRFVSTITSSAPNDIHESAITSNDSNDILESLITSTVHIEPPDGPISTPHVEQHSVTSRVHQLLLDSTPGKCLVRAFWCDVESRRNYSLFGDYITYDPTYSTNKYCIVFTPFTSVDHHKRSVTFAAALLFHKDEDSFKWVFKKFLDAMGQREPHCIITDQCAGIMLGLRAVFKHARRRYCMWHIMQKVTDKVGPVISKETDFVSRLNAIIWDAELEPLEFEEKWSQLVNEHNLEDFQLEATASICSLTVGGFTPPANGTEVIDIVNARTLKTYQVIYNSTTNDEEYSCKLFNRKSIICRHIIWVYSEKQVDRLPDKYILMRWTKKAHKIPLYGLHDELMDEFDATDLRKLEMCKLWSEFYATISVLKNVPKNQITDLADTLKQFRFKLNPQAESMTKEQKLEMLLGCSSSTEVKILPPRQEKNNGSGKRMISKKQRQCIAKAEKPKRLCRNCKQMAHHDKRVQIRMMLMMLMMVDRLKDFSVH